MVLQLVDFYDSSYTLSESGRLSMYDNRDGNLKASCEATAKWKTNKNSLTKSYLHIILINLYNTHWYIAAIYATLKDL